MNFLENDGLSDVRAELFGTGSFFGPFSLFSIGRSASIGFQGLPFKVRPLLLSNYFYIPQQYYLQGILLPMTEMSCIVIGKVQGVAYRVYVQDAATELGITGFVKNQSDGSVQVVAQGLPDQLRSFVEYLHEGSLLAQVEGVTVDWQAPRITYIEFSVLH